MEIEPHTGTFKFLESMITVKDNVSSCQFYLRNYNRNQNWDTKNFLNTQHWGSYSNAPIKRALVLRPNCKHCSPCYCPLDCGIT